MGSRERQSSDRYKVGRDRVERQKGQVTTGDRDSNRGETRRKTGRYQLSAGAAFLPGRLDPEAAQPRPPGGRERPRDRRGPDLQALRAGEVRHRRVTLDETLPQGPRCRGTCAGPAGDRSSRTWRAGTLTTRARLKHPGPRHRPGGAAGARAGTFRGALGSRWLPSLRPHHPSSHPAVPAKGWRSHSRPGTLSAAGTRPVQAVASATASASTSRPRKRFSGPPPETDSASEGASARESVVRMRDSRPRAPRGIQRLRSIARRRSSSLGTLRPPPL